MVVRIRDKTQNYSKVTKLLVKPLDIIIDLVNIYVCGVGTYTLTDLAIFMLIEKN